jgi:hypothetical protein
MITGSMMVLPWHRAAGPGQPPGKLEPGNGSMIYQLLVSLTPTQSDNSGRSESDDASDDDDHDHDDHSHVCDIIMIGL